MSNNETTEQEPVMVPTTTLLSNATDHDLYKELWRLLRHSTDYYGSTSDSWLTKVKALTREGLDRNGADVGDFCEDLHRAATNK